MYLLVCLLGIVMGSFYNVCIYRIPKGESVVSPRSMCGACHKVLTFLDLIPIVSYVFSRGRCRHCKARYSLRYPLVELMTGCFFLLTFAYYGLSPMTLFGWALSSLVIIVSLIDIDHHLIFDRFSVLTIILAVVYHYYQADISLINIGLGFVIGGGLLFLILLLGGMGGGDVKIMASFGLVLGFPKIIMALYLSFIIGGIVSVVYMIVRKIMKKKINREIPFGPFLCMGVWLTFYFGDTIYLWYQRTFLWV